jgi:hypothetical protein
VTVASWCGSYHAAQSEALFNPAAATRGIEVKVNLGSPVGAGLAVML